MAGKGDAKAVPVQNALELGWRDSFEREEDAEPWLEAGSYRAGYERAMDRCAFELGKIARLEGIDSPVLLSLLTSIRKAGLQPF